MLSQQSSPSLRTIRCFPVLGVIIFTYLLVQSVVIVGGTTQGSAPSPSGPAVDAKCKLLCTAFRKVGKLCPDYARSGSGTQNTNECNAQYDDLQSCIKIYSDLEVCMFDIKGYEDRTPSKINDYFNMLLSGDVTTMPLDGMAKTVTDQIMTTRASRSSFWDSFDSTQVTFNRVVAPLIESIIGIMAYNQHRLALPGYVGYIILSTFASSHSFFSIFLKVIPGFLLFSKFDKISDPSFVILQHVFMVWFEVILEAFDSSIALLIYITTFTAMSFAVTSFSLNDRSALRAPLFFGLVYNLAYVLKNHVLRRLKSIDASAQSLVIMLLELIYPRSYFTLINAPAFSLQLMKLLSFIPNEKKLMVFFGSMIVYVCVVIAFGAMIGIVLSDVRGDGWHRLKVGANSYFGYPVNCLNAAKFALKSAKQFDLVGFFICLGFIASYVYMFTMQFDLMFICMVFARTTFEYNNTIELTTLIKVVSECSSDEHQPTCLDVQRVPQQFGFDAIVNSIKYEEKTVLPNNGYLGASLSVPQIVGQPSTVITQTKVVSTSPANGILPLYGSVVRQGWVGDVVGVVKSTALDFTSIPASVKKAIANRVVTVYTNHGMGMAFWRAHDMICTASHVVSDAMASTLIKVSSAAFFVSKLRVCNAITRASDAAMLITMSKEPARVETSDDKNFPSKINIDPSAQGEIPYEKVGAKPLTDDFVGYFYVGPSGYKIIKDINIYDKFFTFVDGTVVPGYSGSPIFGVQAKANANGQISHQVFQIGVISCKFSDNHELVGAVATG